MCSQIKDLVEWWGGQVPGGGGRYRGSGAGRQLSQPRDRVSPRYAAQCGQPARTATAAGVLPPHRLPLQSCPAGDVSLTTC